MIEHPWTQLASIPKEYRLPLDFVIDTSLLTEEEVSEFDSVLDHLNLQPRNFTPNIGIMGDEFSDHYQRAADIITDAIKHNTTICVVYDYDCDGITAGVCLVEALKMLKANVVACVPDRVKQGYGLNTEVVTQSTTEPCLVITVDNGITSVEPTEELSKLGYKVLITDHHLPEGDLPNASFILNPKLYTTEDKDEYMASGCYVAAKLGLYLLRQAYPSTHYAFGSEVYRYWQLFTCLTGLSIISDVIPLNPTMSMQLQLAMAELPLIRHAGIRELCAYNKLKPNQPITTEFIGFYLAPKINSAGRIGNASIAFELLSCWNVDNSDAERNHISSLVNYLHQLNATRKLMENNVLYSASKIIEEKYTTTPSAIVLYDASWHPGVTGIVSSRIVEEYGVPCILLSKSPEDPSSTIVVGSGRAPDGFDLKSLVSQCSEHLIKFGGHKVACGFTLEEAKVKDFEQAFTKVTASNEVKPIPYNYCSEVSIRTLLNPQFHRFLENFTPTGNGNPAPIMKLSNLKIINMDRSNSTLKLLVGSFDPNIKSCILFSKFRYPSRWNALLDNAVANNVAGVDVLCSLSAQYFKGVTTYNYNIVDIRAHTDEE